MTLRTLKMLRQMKGPSISYRQTWWRCRTITTYFFQCLTQQYEYETNFLHGYWRTCKILGHFAGSTSENLYKFDYLYKIGSKTTPNAVLKVKLEEEMSWYGKRWLHLANTKIYNRHIHPTDCSNNRDHDDRNFTLVTIKNVADSMCVTIRRHWGSCLRSQAKSSRPARMLVVCVNSSRGEEVSSIKIKNPAHTHESKVIHMQSMAIKVDQEVPTRYPRVANFGETVMLNTQF